MGITLLANEAGKFFSSHVKKRDKPLDSSAPSISDNLPLLKPWTESERSLMIGSGATKTGDFKNLIDFDCRPDRDVNLHRGYTRVMSLEGSFVFDQVCVNDTGKFLSLR
ncbi:hypothetical protein CEXT_157381 [Caerostris extrusa]|uniref:Uncharacterized protein n=1 Tax=Caerostris extrusa TaxID=172846 RepID=A0AAV4NDC9_CAEEX|nr:hypothetical protein CEXT_157381 [Caerostris extrusa]